jgi:membrane protease YdiL (CAAX protease family)
MSAARPIDTPASPTDHVRPALTLIVALGAAILILLGGQRLFALAYATPGLRGTAPAIVEGLFTTLLFAALLAVALLGRRFDAGRSPSLIGRAPFAAAAAGAAVGLIGLLCAAGLGGLAGNIQPGTGEARGAIAILIGTIAILFQASVEEVYFRGWLQPILVRSWGPAAGVIVASLAFAALHLAGGARSPLTLLNLFLGGLLFGLLALRTGGIAASAAAHALWNWAEQILLGLDPNPGTGSFGALFDLDLVGTAAWGGSDEGLNASLALSFVLVALIVPLLFWRRGRTGVVTAPARPG